MQDSLPQKDRREMKQIHFLAKKEITFTQILASDLMRCFIAFTVKLLHAMFSCCHLFPNEFNDDIRILNAWKAYLTSRLVQPGISMHRKPANFDACIFSKMNRRDNPWTLRPCISFKT